jgi:TonB-linked SusC/RagA family outer membrane protein
MKSALKKPGLHRGMLKPLILIITLSLFHVVSIAQNSGNITLKLKHATLAKVFKSIKEQTGYVFVTGQIDPKNIYLDANFNNADIRTVLSSCLPKLDLQYFIYDKTIVITRGVTDPDKLRNSTGTYEVSGVVLGVAGDILAGATIAVVGTSRGAVTNNNGYFSISGLPANAVLNISYAGYVTEEIPVIISQDLGKIVLKINSNKLDEVHVLAYGQVTSQRYSTGSSVKVSGEEISRQPVGNVLQALAGRVAGLTIRQTSGLPGSDIDVQVRGQNSIDVNAGIPNATNVIKNQPLYIVDGVPFPGSPINVQASSKDPAYGTYNYLTGPNGNGSPLATLSPNDIESIEILKDANATAIYGSRGANGVILITTKKGKAGKVHLSSSVNTGSSAVPPLLPVLPLSEYLALRKEALANDNRTPSGSNAPDLTSWDHTNATDFRKMLLGKPARNVNANLSVSGGTGGTTFIVSGNYSRQSSIFDDNRSSNSYSVHFSAGFTSEDQKFRASVSALLGNNTSNLANINFYETAFRLPPNFPLYDSLGKLYWWNGIPGIDNPLALLNQSYKNSATTINTSINLKYQLLPGLDLQTNIGYNKTQSNQNSLQPSSSFNPSYLAFAQRSAIYVESYSQNVLIEPQINYSRTIGKGNLTSFIGGTIQKSVFEQPFFIRASGFTSDLFLTNLSLATNYQVFNGYNAYNYASVLGRINYLWDKKYIFDANFRRDGSSKFGPNNRYGNFGSVSAAWIFTNEGWLSKRPSWLSFGKLRASLGSVGSDAVENYSFLSTYLSNSGTYYSGANGLAPTRLANPDFKWESTQKAEAGLDLSFFKDRLFLSVGYYRNVTGNQLLQYPLPGQTGFSNYVQNFNAKVENYGWELTMSGTNIKTKNFSWTTSLNTSLPRNKLLSYPGLDSSENASYFVVGKPLSAQYLLHYTGVGPNGLPTYTDVDKDGKITTLQGYNTGYGDLLYAGKSQADLNGGIGNTFRYKGLQIDAFFQFTIGAVDRGIFASLSAPPGGMANVPQAVVNKLRELGLSKLFSSSTYSQDFNNLVQSDALLGKLSYGRLTNVSLSYSLPQEIIRRFRIGGISMYLRAQNLFLVKLGGTTYTGIDPETGPKSVPPLRVIVGGLQFSL